MMGTAKVGQLRDIELEDLLGREVVPPDPALLSACITGKVVMVTGGGGSIGSELCRQIVRCQPRELVLLDISEYSLYAIANELEKIKQLSQLKVDIIPLLGSVLETERVLSILETFSVNTIYHAAAYKHVPMVEHNIVAGVNNNVMGTLSLAGVAVEARVENFVLISTDKAVRPTNIMGATKRMAELVLQAFAHKYSETRFSMVRFGNVLGSSGSVVPLFRQQIIDGGPVTVTHKDITRYFMTIPEAAQLVLQAGAMGRGGDVFVLDMGEPVKILDLASRLIRLMGSDVKDAEHPTGDIEIQITGLRPGEKLFEELLLGDNVSGTSHSQIMRAEEDLLDEVVIDSYLTGLKQAAADNDCQKIHDILSEAVSGFYSRDGVSDVLWSRRKGLLSDKNVVRATFKSADS
jgi:FlaA1/EpsC-like NDP-sugar epimerase